MARKEVKLFDQPEISDVTGYRFALRNMLDDDPKNIKGENLILPRHYTKLEMQTSGSSSVNWLNITDTPTGMSGYGISFSILEANGFPNTFTGHAGKQVRVNSGENGLEFVSVTPYSYSLPIASSSVLGGIRVGANLTIDANGILNANAGGGGTGDAVWGSITGTLTNQVDLNTALSLKADLVHNHNDLYYLKSLVYSKVEADARFARIINLTDGYIPYFVNAATGLANSKISSDGTNTIINSGTIGTNNFASKTIGWRGDYAGNWDMRYLFTDELRAKAFTADISQALAGSDFLTKSVSKLSETLTIPTNSNSVRMLVDDLEGFPATRCFVNGDNIRLRIFDRTGGGLVIADVWGYVIFDTTYGSGGYLDGKQAYTFTSTDDGGVSGLQAFKGAEVLDYGTSGSGVIERTVLDPQGSPYSQVVTWLNDPSVPSNYTLRTRTGNLGGIQHCSGYGLYGQNTFLTGKLVAGDLSKLGDYIEYTTGGGLVVKGNITITGGNAETQSGAASKAMAAQNTAINTASGDATTKANTAKNDAINAAALDATTKANTAKSEAISTAALDATAKATIAGGTAAWGGISNVPTRLQDTTPDNSLGLTSTFMGFHGVGSNWPIKIYNDGGTGKFYAGSDVSDNYISWNGSSLVTKGTIYADNGYFSGAIYAASGTIGGWVIYQSALYSNNGLQSCGMSPNDYPFYAGNTYFNRSIAPFRVTSDGTMIATKGTIAGWTIGTDAIYVGTKKTTDGYAISGITLASNGSIHAKNFYLNADGGIGLQAPNTISGISGYFRVGDSGAVMGFDDYAQPILELNPYYGLEFYNYLHVRQAKFGLNWNTQTGRMSVKHGSVWTTIEGNKLLYGASEEELITNQVTAFSWTIDGLNIDRAVAFKMTSLSPGYYVTKSDTLMRYSYDSNGTIYLPSAPNHGQLLMIVNTTTNRVLTIDGNGKSIIDSGGQGTTINLNDRRSMIFIYNGISWSILSYR